VIEANAQLLARAQALLSSGRPAESERLYRQLLQHTHVIDFEYDEWLKGIAECYRVLGRAREAGYVYLYLHAFDRAAEMFPSATAPVDAARVKELEGRRIGGEAGNKLYAESARQYAEANRHVLAAIAYASANSPRDERRAWERVLRDPRLRGRMYEEALVHFNVGIAAMRDGDKEGGNRHLVSAQRLLEEVADEFETHGERHRAFDCYCILLKLGRTRRASRTSPRATSTASASSKRTTSSSTCCSTTKTSCASRSSARSTTQPRRCFARRPTTRAASASSTIAAT